MKLSPRSSVRKILLSLVPLVFLPGSLAWAQANQIPGLDVHLSNMRAIEAMGREGVFPNGMNGVAVETTVCNEGTVEVPWFEAMNPAHPTIAFMVASVRDGRMQQLSNRSHVKHGFFALNGNGCQLGCVPPPTLGVFLGLGCTDTYGTVNNGDNYYLGAPDEIDPWLGTWTRQCSLFDRGFPDVGAPANCDGHRSLTHQMAVALGPVGNRIHVSDEDLVLGGAFFFQGQYVVEGMPEAARDDALGSRPFDASWNGSRWVLTQNGPLVPGTTSVTLSTGSVTTPEICANGRDDDGNGLVDCQDAACSNHTSCIGSLCVPDFNIGTLVVDGPARSATIDTRTATDDYQSTCSAGVAGGDVAFEFTLAETAGVEVEFQQTGRSIFAIFRMPPPGLACDTDQARCSYQDDARNAVAFLSLSAGRYVFVAKAQSTSLSGVINLRISAFGLRPVEICGNKIDDDSDGLTDCDDPECFGLVTCPTPACNLDQDLGNFSWGTQRTVTIDTRDGVTLWPTSCSRGTGKEKVLRLNLLQPMSLGFDCMDGGSHVLAVARQVQPLDACNANQLVCVDPSVLPFGCGYSLPNLQPGQYNVLVQAFQAGSEGLVNLTLTGQQEIIRETCDNGIDDDGDGATDCADRKCATDLACRKFACRPEQMAGILPLDGSLRSLVVQTAAAGDDQMQTSCASAPGGQDGVIDFQVPATADVAMQWAQVGDHDFALYDDEGMALACDAGRQRVCVASLGVVTGMHVFSALPPGRYHLVVDADRPGKEGGVVVQLSAVASPMP
jgi:hypothetical protein